VTRALRAGHGYADLGDAAFLAELGAPLRVGAARPFSGIDHPGVIIPHLLFSRGAWGAAAAHRDGLHQQLATVVAVGDPLGDVDVSDATAPRRAWLPTYRMQDENLAGLYRAPVTT
jgi:hypothetical protein